MREALAPLPESRDMVIIVHEMDVEYPGTERPSERQVFTMVEYGRPASTSAMAICRKTVDRCLAV